MTNLQKIYAFVFTRFLLVMMPIIVPFYEYHNLTMHQVFQLTAFFSVVVMVMEIPSGYISDLFSRRGSLIFGCLLVLIGYTFLNFAHEFWHFMIHRFILACGFSFISGTDIAIMYDSLKEEERERHHTTKALAHYMFLFNAAESSAALLGAYLASQYSFEHAVAANTIIGTLPLIIAFTLKEPKIDRMNKTKHIENFKEVFRYIFYQTKFVRIVSFNLICWGLASFTAVWLFQKHWSNSNISLTYFGLLWAAYNITAGVVGKQVNHWQKKFGAWPLVLITALFPAIGYLGMGLFAGWLGVVAGLLFYVSRGINQVLIKDLLNYNMPSKFRATANSIVSFCVRTCFAITGPAVGYSVDNWGLSTTLFGLSGVYFFCFVLFAIPLLFELRHPDHGEKNLQSSR